MKKGYWVVAYRSISDEHALQEYGKLAVAAIAAHGGQPSSEPPGWRKLMKRVWMNAR